MNARSVALLTAALAAVLLLVPRRGTATPIDHEFIDDPSLNDAPEFPGPVTEGYSDDSIDWGLINWFEGIDTVNTGSPSDNLRGFLYMLRSCEHLSGDVARALDYGTFFGGGRFYNFADHPVNTGELRGVPLKPEWCRAAGFASGRCVSTAAGAYQFTRPTWDGLRASGRHGPRLPDFSPASQDEAARRLLAQIGALAMIEAGNIEGAIRVASARWASLPGSTSGQPQKSMQFALAKFNEGVARA